HTGISTETSRAVARAWLTTARHPRFDKPYAELVYQPMLEVMKHLQENDFRTYLVTAGGQEFVRSISQDVYKIPPSQVVGSCATTRYQVIDGRPELIIEPRVMLVDDKAGKPSGIEMFIGARPIIAFGNSDGDREMLEWTTLDHDGLAAIVVHSDAEREYA